MVGSIVEALSGTFLVKLALSAVVVSSFLFLKARETEGAIGRYALLGAFFAFRDLAFALFPLDPLFRASDLILFAGLLHLRVRGLGTGWLHWVPFGLALAGAAALGLGAAFGFPSPWLSTAVWALCLFPAAAACILPVTRSGESRADEPERVLARRSSIPLAVGSLVYLGAEAAAGPSGLVFQSLVAPLFYGLFASLAFVFSGILTERLVRAVDYYEESVDSLYELLLSAGRATKPEFSLQDVVDSVTRVIVERTGAAGGILALADEYEDTVSVRSLCGSYPPPFRLPESLPREPERVAAFVRRSHFKLGDGPIGAAAAGRILFAPSGGEGLPDNGDEDWLRPGGLIVVPLAVGGRAIGAVSVAKPAGGRFSDRDFERCKLLADFGSIAVANSFSFLEAAERSDIEREAAIALNVRNALLPKAFPELPGLDIAVSSNPARGVCSDYFDVVQTARDRAIVAVGDVAGKGVAASLVMVMIRAILHLVAPSAKDAASLLQWINRGLSGKMELDHYATLGLVAVDAAGGQLEFSNAGHQPLIIYRADADSIETVELKSVPIGVERGSSFDSRRLALRPGDLLVMYTDGVVEAMNEQGKQFGRKNLGNAVQRRHAMPAEALASAIKDELGAFVGRARQHDDQTILVLKAAGR